MATKSTKSTKTTRAKVAAPAAKRAATSAKKAPRARTQPKGLALSAVSPSFTVDDLEKSIGWYRDVLGFAVTDRWEHEGKLMGVELQAGGVTFMLGQDDWKKGRDRVKGEALRIYCETTQDVDRLAEQIKARGGTLAQEPTDESWGARRISVDDPDGFKITLFKMLPRRR